MTWWELFIWISATWEHIIFIICTSGLKSHSLKEKNRDGLKSHNLKKKNRDCMHSHGQNHYYI